MTKNEFLRLEQELIGIAKRHNAEFNDRMSDFDEIPFFIINKHNVPVLADMRMLAERYGISDAVDSQPSWGYVALDFSFVNAEECEWINQ